jgi:hypothetical protein
VQFSFILAMAYIVHSSHLLHIDWLKGLGLTLTVVVDEQPKDNRSITQRGSEVAA